MMEKQKLKLFVHAHKALVIDNYDVLERKCCNPFKTHKNTVKQNFRVTSVKFTKDLQKNQLAIIPGKKFVEIKIE